MTALDGLRPPPAFDPDAPEYKDWLHLNLFEPRSGLVGLVNVALHGDPEDRRARAVGTALAHLPGLGWVGNVETAGLDDARIGEDVVGLRHVALALDPARGDVHVAVSLAADRLTIKATAHATTPQFALLSRVPLGRGWISWTAVPRLRPSGVLRAHDRTVELDGAAAYHDHNWGRWRWGDDLGWEWGCFPDAGGDLTVVVSRTSDRDHRRRGAPHVLVQHGRRRRAFSGRMVRIDRGGVLQAPVRRVPGALAALHGHRARPRLPAEVRVEASDGRDRLAVTFTAEQAAQVTVAEVERPGYGFIHEIAGRFTAEGVLSGEPVRAAGPGIFEHVD